jgi:integrase
MASIDKRPDGSYRARWREYPGGPQKTKHFARKLDAERHLVKVQHDLLAGTYVAPEASRATLESWYRTWSSRMEPTWRPQTYAVVSNNFEKHIIPTLGARPLSSLRRGDLEAFYASLSLAPSTVGIVAQHLGQALRGAVEDGLLVRNPAERARLPRRDEKRAQPVPLDVIERIHAALPDWLAVVVPLGVGAGLRQAEMTGLTVDRVDFLRRIMRVDRQLVDRTREQPVLAPPKTSSSNRTVPLANFVVEALSAHLANFPRESEQFVLLDPEGLPVPSGRFGHQWRRAAKAAGAQGLRYHDLRHTFASTLLSRGVSVKAVADWLGHASPVVTLSTYAHLMPADADVARTVLDAALQGAEDQVRTVETPKAL